jgi:hypothetical protein
MTLRLRGLSGKVQRRELAALRSNNAGGPLDLNYATCSAQITTPVDDPTLTVPFYLTYCSTGAIVIDSVAAGSGIVQINGAWRLT